MSDEDAILKEAMDNLRESIQRLRTTQNLRFSVNRGNLPSNRVFRDGYLC